jgi:hypothetical protein
MHDLTAVLLHGLGAPATAATTATAAAAAGTPLAR